MKKLITISLALTSAFAMAAPRQTTPAAPQNEPVAFIKWSMDRYATAQCLSAAIRTEINTGTSLFGVQRSSISFFRFQRPNKFKLTMVSPQGFSEIVSDGVTQLFFCSSALVPPTTMPAPRSIDNGLGSGELIFTFLGGSGDYPKLVKELKSSPVLGQEEEIEGAKCRRVSIGATDIWIDEATGFIRKQFAGVPSYLALPKPEKPLSPATKQKISEELSLIPPGQAKDQAIQWLHRFASPGAESKPGTTETYSDIETPASLPSNTFDSATPAGMKAEKESELWKSINFSDGPKGYKPPFAIGAKVTDFQIKDVAGKTVKLSSFRGRVVLLDFCSTESAVSRRSFAEINDIARDYAKNHYAIVEVSDEDPKFLAFFFKTNHYVLKAFHDVAGEGAKAFKVKVRPSSFVIDAAGKLRAYVVGKDDGEALDDAMNEAKRRP